MIQLTREEIAGQVAMLRGLAEEGSATAKSILVWIDSPDDFHTSGGTYPDDILAANDLSQAVGNTAKTFFHARALKYMSDHGRAPDGFTVTIDIQWHEPVSVERPE